MDRVLYGHLTARKCKCVCVCVCVCVCLAVSVATAGHSNDGKRQCPYCHKSFSAVVFKNHKVSNCRSWVDRHTYVYVMLLYSRG